MTRDCGKHRDDQRLRTVQMTADLWGGRGSGYLNLTGTRSYFRRVFFLSYLFLYPAARCLPGFCSVGARRTAGCPVRMREKRCAL
ncbi:unnamed protein product [Staurois parvus]|uniref:Uncharacterized protein n=1 Tax=Staurois parvus TaxID=386267 RepID=A0ABN9HV12_9NEOB|nr:unnamed protein product [Staurois parvus]